MLRPGLTAVLLTMAAVSPVAGMAVWSIHRSAVEFADPCARWANTKSVAVAVDPQDACRGVTVHAESKAHAAAVAAMVPGVLLAAATLAVAGAARSRRRMMLTAAIAMLAETLVAFTIAPLALLAGVSVLLLAKRPEAG